MKSTDYENTLIEIAEDCKAKAGEIPPYRREKKTVANHEYEIIFNNPYKYTSGEVKFAVHIISNEIPKSRHDVERDAFFSKGQPCFRASPLTKTYGWGIHPNGKGRVALFGVESKEYSAFLKDATIVKVKAIT